MGIKNTKDTYGSLAKWFHWATAFCFLALFITPNYRAHFMQDSESELGMQLVQIHLMLGWTVFFLLLPRLIWKLTHIQPAEPPGKAWEHLAARLGHWALYALAIAMFVTGYLGTHDDTHYLYLFDIPQFQDTPMYGWLMSAFSFTWEEFEAPVDFIHKELLGNWVMLFLVGIHVVAALYHHFVKRDTTLVRMIPGMSAQS